MAKIEIPSDIIFPPAKDKEQAQLYQILSDYFTKLRQTLIEIESKLP
jgi:outer membrane protein OmpA-like peptidoglycan-associated protein